MIFEGEHLARQLPVLDFTRSHHDATKSPLMLIQIGEIIARVASLVPGDPITVECSGHHLVRGGTGTFLKISANTSATRRAEGVPEVRASIKRCSTTNGASLTMSSGIT